MDELKSILESSIITLKGIGERRAKELNKLGIKTLSELLNYFPRVYIDMSKITQIADLIDNETATLNVRVTSSIKENRISEKLSIFTFNAADDSGSIQISLFNQKFTAQAIKFGDRILLYGKPEVLGINKQMKAPQIDKPENAKIKPIYPMSENVRQKMMQNIISETLARVSDSIPETMTIEMREKYGLMSLSDAYKNIHLPEKMSDIIIARNRIIFEEFLLFQLGIFTMKKKVRLQFTNKLDKNADMNVFYDSLPYKLTSAQQRTINEALTDLKRENPMSRLVQGDVGSGKTVVAAGVMYYVHVNGCQSCMMAPTEILAIQHYHTLTNMLNSLGLKIALLTSSTPKKDREIILNGIKNGEIDILVGTHAVIQSTVIFNNLSLVVTDEQHRFGVEQRAALSQKGQNPHMMVMSATPIPRTLALIIYGDLDVSVIDELPPGRQKISTHLVDSTYHERMYLYVREKVKQGEQAYVVCPLVEENENSEAKSAVEFSNELKEKYLNDVNVGFLHGKMKSKEKETTLTQFVAGEIDVLVSTTVIEVGVDVPNATIMIVENAEKFGLSQLHQLRGRVGRGKKKSFCFLVSDTQNGQTLKRLKALCSSNDGFEISKKDLELRGPGDFFGDRQHGLPMFKMANLARDMDILHDVQQAAKEILENPFWFENVENINLKQAVLRMFKDIGETVL